MMSRMDVSDNISNFFYNINVWKYDYRDYIVEKIEEIDISDWFKNDGIHRVFLNSSLSIDFCIVGTEYYENAQSCLVCFSGAVSGDRSQKLAPVFSGFGISKELKLPLISISDPTLALSKDINISWYAGNKMIPDLLVSISKLLDRINDEINKKLILFGGSGGGFASLAVAQTMQRPVKVCTVNPQTQIINYNASFVKAYLSNAYDIDYNKFEKNLSTKSELEFALEQYVLHHNLNRRKFNEKTEIIYLQNISDWHVKAHAIPYLKDHSMSIKGNSTFISLNQRIGLYLGNWGEGHAPITKDILYKAIELIDQNYNVEDILNQLDKINKVNLPSKVTLNLCENEIKIDSLKEPTLVNINLDEKITFYREAVEKKSTLIIEITLVSDHYVGPRELLHSVDYVGELSEKDILNLGYFKTTYKNSGYFKYIYTKENSIYKAEILLSFPIGIKSLNFEIKGFYPKGLTKIFNSKIRYID